MVSAVKAGSASCFRPGYASCSGADSCTSPGKPGLTASAVAVPVSPLPPRALDAKLFDSLSLGVVLGSSGIGRVFSKGKESPFTALWHSCGASLTRFLSAMPPAFTTLRGSILPLCQSTPTPKTRNPLRSSIEPSTMLFPRPVPPLTLAPTGALFLFLNHRKGFFFVPFFFPSSP